MTEYASLREKIAAESAERKARTAKFEIVWAEASSEASKAGAAAATTPMVVAEDRPGGQRWYVPEGACGFAWVKVRPGTSAFAKWLVKTGKARASYQGGVQIWISEHQQSVERKEAHARKLAEVLREKLGVEAYADSRLD